MKLEFWLDYLSPLCFKQHLELESLLKKFKFTDLEILYRSYEMLPLFDPMPTCTFFDVLSKHHVISIEEAQMMFHDIPQDLRPVKVKDAHRLSHLAKKTERAFEFNQHVFHAYYEGKLDISKHDHLIEIATEAGLPIDQVKDVLNSNRYEDAVHLNRENAIVKGIFEVPHIRIDGKIRLSGLHNEEQLLEALIMSSAKFSKTDYCEGENCARKKTR
jgi:predicted DsbA family dithiol-disulfide isomerase